MKKLKYILFLIAFSSFSLFAEQGGKGAGDGYMWTDMETSVSPPDTVITYDWIDVRDANSLISGVAYNDSLSPATSIGFNFSFYGETFSQVYVSTNGWLSFADIGSSDPVNLSIPDASAPDSMIAVFWDDLVNDDINGGVFFKTEGTSPNRKFIVQWDAINSGAEIEFQIILYETSNLIKLQWGQIAAGYNNGGSATIGIQNTASDALQYSFDTANIEEYSAILFHGEGVTSADATILPTSVDINTLQQFTYTVDNFSPLTDGMGKVDTVSIDIPMGFGSPIVTNIDVNSTSTFIQNSTSKPAEGGFSTWNYTGSAIQVQTADFEVINALDVTYYLQTPAIPTTSGPVDFTSSFGAILDTNAMQAATEVEYSVNVNALVDYYSFTPANDTSVVAGNNLVFTLKAHDINGDGIENSDSAIVSQIGTRAITFTPDDTLDFGGDSVVTVTVSKDSIDTFTLNVVGINDPTVSGTSGLITVNPDVAANIIDLTGLAQITAGATQILRVAIEDQYGNRFGAGTDVFFSINAGNGSLNDTSPVQTDADGIVEMSYTADILAGGTDIINVTSTVNIQISLPVDAGEVSYYTFSPSADSIIAAGETIQFTVTAKDQYGNDKNNNGSFTLAGQGSSSEVFGGSPYVFGGGNNKIITVSDNTAGQFTVVATNTVDSNIKGSSGELTVTPDAANQLSILSSEADIIAGTARILNVALEDQYGNRIGADSSITFTRLVGTGLFDNGLNSIMVLTKADGTADTTYTASATSGGTDQIQVSYGAVTNTINLPVIDGTLAEIRIQTAAGDGGAILDDTSLAANLSLGVFAEGYDAQGNYISAVSVTWGGSGVVSGNIPAGPTTGATFTPVQTGSGKITATNGSINDISGTITVTAGPTQTITIMDEPGGTGSAIAGGAINLGDVVNLYANGFDDDSNFSGNESVTWDVTGTLSRDDLTDTIGTSSTIYIPQTTGIGRIEARSAYPDAQTGIFTVSPGALSILRIRTEANNAGIELGDSVFFAGDAPVFYAAGYDDYGNFIGDQPVSWSIEKVDGDSIGFYTSSGNVDNNTFNATVVNSGRLKINSGAITAYSGTIKIKNGTPATLTAITSTTLSGTAGAEISDSLGVRLLDAFGNAVPDSTIDWTTPSNGSLNPATSLTTGNGVARSKWTLRDDVATNDTAYATYGLLTPVEFTASVNPSDADQMSLSSGDPQSGTVGNAVTLPLVVLVEDQFSIPVSGVPITFSVTSFPAGASGFSFGSASVTTNGSGQASTTFTLGDKIGTYVVAATNAQLLGSPVTFTLTADADGVDHLVMFSGDEQSGTVNTTLASNVIIKAEDQYGNPVQGVDINWTAVSGGSINDLGSTLTDASGLDAADWTLTTLAGGDTITATDVGASLNTITYTATANPDIPDDIVAVSGNGESTIAGGNLKIEARVIDQFLNPVPGATGVSFSPANRMSALNTVPDSNGLVSAVYTAPQGVNSSVAQAVLASPAATADFTVYGIGYVAGSLTPDVTSSGENVNFYIQVNNPGSNSVQIDQALSQILISGNGFADSAAVDSPAVIAASAVTDIKFVSMLIDAGFDGFSYTPLITLVGDGADNTKNGSFYTDVGELSVSPLEITQINIPGPEDTLSVSRGGSIAVIQMTVRNNGTNTIDTFVPNLNFAPDDGYVEALLGGGPASLSGGASGTFSFSLSIPSDAVTGIKVIDGDITAELQGTSDQVSDISSALTDSFNVIDATDITWISYTPDQITDGQNVTFTASVRNDGPFDLVLDRENTSILFGANTFDLASNNVLEGNSVISALVFESANLSVADNTPAILQINGTEEGNAFSESFSSDTTAGINNLTVQTAANVVYNTNTLSSASVSQGANGETYQFQITNNGEATAIINALDSITVFVDGSDISLNSDYQSSLTSGQSFPLLIAGSGSETFIFTIDVDANATVGTDVFSSQVNFTDANSSVTTTVASSGNPSWNVQARSAFSITVITATDTEVAQGQGGLNVDVTVANTGDVTALVDTVYLDFFKNVNSFSATMPASIAGGGSTIISFTVTIDPGASTGVDSIRAVAVGTNSQTAEAISTTSAYLDSWTVNTAGNVFVNAVTSTISRVNRGQQNVPVSVTITNNGLNTVNIDSIVLANTPAGSTSDTLISAIGSVTAGQTLSYNFQSDILPGAANTVILGAEFYGTDNITGLPVNDLTAAAVDTFFVDDPSMLQIDSVYASFSSFTQGQSNLDVRVSVSNIGTSNISLDSLRLDITPIDAGAGSTLGYTQISPTEPNLPTLASGASSVVLFRLISPSSPADSGTVQIDARVYGRDELSQIAQSDLSAGANVDQVLLQTAADPLITQINNHPANVAQGETNITVDVVIENQGSATARIENVAINFFNASLENRNQDYSRDYPVSPVLPFNLAGWADSTINFTVGVLDSAELGTINLGGMVQSTELNRNLPVTNNDSSISSWDVLGNGSISILSVSSSRDSVSAGHQDIPITVTVRNGGNTEVRIDSLQLVFSRGSYSSTFITPVSGNVLASSTQANFQIDVDIDGGSVSGVSTIDAEVYGFDTENALAVSRVGADTGDSWLVQQPVNFIITDNTPFIVSTDQLFSHQLMVENTGEARLVIDNVNTVVYPSSFPASSVGLDAGAPVVIEGNQTVTLPFVATSSATPFLEDVILDIFGTDNGVAFNQQYTAPNQLNVQSEAVMVIDSTVAVEDSVSQGETPAVTVYISNSAEAGLVVNSLTFSEYGAFIPSTPTLPDTIAGGSQSSYAGTVDVSAITSTGTVVLDVSGSGTDANSAVVVSDADADTPDSWFVTTAPDIVVSTITSTDTLVTQNQSGLTIDVTIRNDGETPVDLTGLTLLPTIGLYDQVPGALGRLNGNDSVTVSVTVDVRSNSATGDDQIYATVNYQNLYSLENSEITSSVFHQWEIGGTPSLAIVSVQTLPTTVSQGQDSVDLQVRLHNNGETSVSIDMLDLVFVNGAANYTIAGISPTLPLAIPAGLEQIFTIPVSINPAAQLGNDSISADIDYVSSSGPLNVADPRINDSWEVQTRPVVLIDSVSVNPSNVSVGQEGLTGSVYLSNAFAVNRATAQIDSVNIVMELASVNQNAQFSINQVLIPTLPFDLQPGATNRIDFNMDAKNDALTGTYTTNGYVISQDMNDGVPDTNSTAVLPGQLVIEDSALVVIDTLWVTPDTISQGQNHGRIFVQITNTGSGSAEIKSSLLSFTPGLTDLNQIYFDPPTPFILAGGETDTLRFQFEASSVYNGTVDVDVTVNGEDVNSGNSFVESNANFTTFLIQTPAELSWLDSSPPSTPGNQFEQFMVQIENTGESAIVVDGSTYFKLEGFDILLDASSPTVLIPGDTTTLIFENTQITGLPSNQNFPLTLYLFGNTNGASYSEVIPAGSIAYGENLITLTAIVIQGEDIRFQGEENVAVNMSVSNGAGTLSIDSTDTFLWFEDASSGTPRSVSNLRRTDGLTEITGNQTINFAFDIPVTFPLGEVNIYGRVSLDNGNVVIDSDTLTNVFDALRIISPALVTEDGNTSPDKVVAGQTVSFVMDFSNDGAASIALDADSSYIEFIDATPVIRRYLSGGFTIPGNGTSAISFNDLIFPTDSPAGSYNIAWHLFGEMLNADTASFDSIAFNAFEIVDNAEIAFTSIDIIPTIARQGQEDIRINYTVQNTGDSEAIMDYISFGFNKSGNPVDEGWLQTTLNVFPDTISPGGSSIYNVDFTVQADADTGSIVPDPVAHFRDIRVPGTPLTSNTINPGANDQIDIVAPARIRIDSLFFDISGGFTPNHPFVNIDQPFKLAVSITNTGNANITSGTLNLKKNGNTVQTRSFFILSAQDSRIISFNQLTESTQNEHAYTVELSNVLEGIFSVTPDQALDNSETVIVQQPRQLSLVSFVIDSAESAQDGTVTVGQEFKVVATIASSGQSEFSSGILGLDLLLANFSVTENLERTINDSTLSITWYITAETASTNNTISVALDTVPTDLNTRNPVATGITQRDFLMTVDQAGSINVTSLEKTTPFGSRQFISTSQQFTLQAKAVINKAFADTTATLDFPSERGYSLVDLVSEQLGGDTVSWTWTVVAPEEKELTFAPFSVTLRGEDLNTGSIVEAFSGNLNLNLRRRAEISLSTTIINPPGAIDNGVSTLQEVVLRTLAINSGEAGFDGSGTIQLSAQNSALFKDNGGFSATLSKAGFSTTAIMDTLVIPASPGVASMYSFITPGNLPNDENSGEAVLLKVDTSRQTFTITERADLKLSLFKQGAIDNVLLRATNQRFDLNAVVTNRGSAAVDTSAGHHFVVLDTVGTGLKLPGQNLRRPFSIDSVVTWTITNPADSGLVKAKVHIDDAVYPVDINDNLNAFRTEESKRDSLYLDVIPVDSIIIAASFSNTDTSDIVDSLIVGQNQDSIYVEALVTFDEQLKFNRHIDLRFPENLGYSMQQGNIINDVDGAVIQQKVSWLIKASQQTSGADPDTIKIYAFSRNEDSLLVDARETDLIIRTIPKASLDLQLSIDQPDGARNGVVTVGQEFRLRGFVETEELTEVTGTGLVQVDFDTEFFSLVSSTNEIEFTEGEEFFWWIRAEGVTQSGLDMPGIINALSVIEKSDNDIKKKGTIQSKKSALKKETKNALNRRMTKLGQLLAEGLNLSVSITQPPLDATLGVEADLEQGAVFQNVVIVPSASIAIESVSSQDTVSTSQIFEFSVQAGQKTSNFVNPNAAFIIPSNLSSTGVLDTTFIPLSSDNLVANTSIAVPSNYKGNGTETVGVYIWGVDNNAPEFQPRTLDSQKILTIEKRPDITVQSEIIQPTPTNNAVQLSYGQEIQINVWPELATNNTGLEYAGLIGNGEISLSQSVLIESGFKLSIGEPISKTFDYNELGESNPITWKLRAPQDELETDITFELTELPEDINSGLNALSPSNATASVVRVRQKEIVITFLDSLLGNSYLQGDQDVPLVAFALSNIGFTDSLFVNALRVKFKNNNNELSPADLDNLFARLKVVNYDYIEAGGLPKTSVVLIPESFADFEIMPDATNPFDLDFNIVEKLTINPNQKDTLLVVADFGSIANNISFTTILSNVTVYDVADSIELKLIDDAGNTYESENIVRPPLTIVDVDKNFYSYPNPFGRGNTPEEKLAYFNFHLDQISDVKIQVFTLLGELVWSATRESLGTGVQSRAITWDGKNSNGKRVLNGGYIGSIEIRPTNGGKTTRHITKIIYIK